MILLIHKFEKYLIRYGLIKNRFGVEKWGDLVWLDLHWRKDLIGYAFKQYLVQFHEKILMEYLIKHISHEDI